MFERFAKSAREVVVLAQEAARERGADRIRSEHLLAAMFVVPDHLARTVLAEAGVTRAGLDDARTGPSDAEALATLGIDLDEVRRQVEDAFGPGALDRTRAALGREGRWTGGHIPFDRSGKKVLELALREALLLGHRHIGTEHILLGMLHPMAGGAQQVLERHGLRLDATRHRVDALVRGRRAS